MRVLFFLNVFYKVNFFTANQKSQFMCVCPLSLPILEERYTVVPDYFLFSLSINLHLFLQTPGMILNCGHDILCYMYPEIPSLLVEFQSSVIP